MDCSALFCIVVQVCMFVSLPVRNIHYKDVCWYVGAWKQVSIGVYVVYIYIYILYI